MFKLVSVNHKNNRVAEHKLWIIHNTNHELAIIVVGWIICYLTSSKTRIKCFLYGLQFMLSWTTSLSTLCLNLSRSWIAIIYIAILLINNKTKLLYFAKLFLAKMVSALKNKYLSIHLKLWAMIVIYLKHFVFKSIK